MPFCRMRLYRETAKIVIGKEHICFFASAGSVFVDAKNRCAVIDGMVSGICVCAYQIQT